MRASADLLDDRTRGRTPGLPRREQQILALVEAGETSGEIARRLGLSPRSVDSAVHRARLRLGAATRLQAAILAADRPPAASAMHAGANVDLVDEVQDLLRALCGGATVTGAARTLGLSRRTASRRLAELRGQVGVASTAEAVVVMRSLLTLDDGSPVERTCPARSAQWLDAS